MTKTVTLKQLSGVTFVAKANSNHWVVMDGSPDFGGSLAGSTPKELLLMALAGCTSSDVVPILKKRQVPVQGYELYVKAEEREEHPRIFTSIHVEYVFYGEGIEKADVERAIEMSTTKYCSVSAILKSSVPITHSYRIEPVTAMSSSTRPMD
jgi:putative redox protein